MKTSRKLPFSLLLIIAGIPAFHSCRKDEMKVETTAITKIMSTSAIAQGNIIDLGEGVEQSGHCWAENPDPTIIGEKTEKGPASNTGMFSSDITGLAAGTTYHVRAYLQSGREIAYGQDITFTTPDGKASLTTTEVTNITFNSAGSGGNISSINGDQVISRGVCWDTLETLNLMINDGFTANGSGTGGFTSELTGLTPGKLYYVKAYAISSVDTSYGISRNFVTLDGRGILTTTTPTSVTATTAVTGGNITYDGGSSITLRGVCYGTNENPTLAGNKTTDSDGTGTFTSSLSGLNPNATYYVRAYATNDVTTSYGGQQSFMSKGLPELTTASVTELTDSTATCGGNITSDWGYPVTERGVCWSTSQNPSTTNSRTVDGSGTGSYSSSLSGLSKGVTYYVRAYASNSVGASYGQQRTFILIATPIVEVTNPATGKTWMDRNLGAVRPASSSTDVDAYGDLYQWGRDSDGHEKRNSSTTTTLSSSDTPGHGRYITSSKSPSDWRSPQNDNLWQVVNTTNNPCPTGYRLPTEAEWEAERKSWSSNNANGAFTSPLKLPVAGDRDYRGSVDSGAFGRYWSSSYLSTYAMNMRFDVSDAHIINSYRVNGYSIRCIKE